MTTEEMNNLDVGDVIRHVSNDSGNGYIVVGNYGNHVTAIREIDVTNPEEWVLTSKVTGRKNR